jgi:hypothetical protein
LIGAAATTATAADDLICSGTEYLANLPITGPAGDFIRNSLVNIGDYSVHVRGHPSGFIVLLKFLDAIGLGGSWPVVAISQPLLPGTWHLSHSVSDGTVVEPRRSGPSAGFSWPH